MIFSLMNYERNHGLWYDGGVIVLWVLSVIYIFCHA